MAKLTENQIKNRPWYEQAPYSGFWERGYADLSAATLGGPSPEVIELASALPRNTRVLDLGCGEGRNALYLATRGCIVIAIDRSEAAIRKLRHMADRAGVMLTADVADIATLDIDDEYDVAMGHGILHYLTNPEWRELLAKVKRKTVSSGFNIYTIDYFNDEYPRSDEFRAAGHTNSFRPDELREFFVDWDIIRYDVYAKWDGHPGVPMHCHPIEKLLARKPATNLPADYHIERVPIGEDNLPHDVFNGLRVGMAEEEVRGLCGSPQLVDIVKADGLQYGAFEAGRPGGYEMQQWYYGRMMVEIADGKLRAKNRYKTPPVRVRFAPVLHASRS